MLSGTLDPCNGIQMGFHPLVKRNGMLPKIPQIPRYSLFGIRIKC